MTDHKCLKEEEWGRLHEFMESFKGFKPTLWTIVLAIIVQVGTFLFLWGKLTTTVQYHEESIKKLWSKIENIKIVGYANADTKNGK
jgi:hypothetical protein